MENKASKYITQIGNAGNGDGSRSWLHHDLLLAGCVRGRSVRHSVAVSRGIDMVRSDISP